MSRSAPWILPLILSAAAGHGISVQVRPLTQPTPWHPSRRSGRHMAAVRIARAKRRRRAQKRKDKR